MLNRFVFYVMGFSLLINDSITANNNVKILNVLTFNITNDSQILFLSKSSEVNNPVDSFNTSVILPNESRHIIKRNAANSISEKLPFQVELGIYGYCKMILFIILRIFFGIALDVSKIKEILKRPIGPFIAISCNFVFLPLVSC